MQITKVTIIAGSDSGGGAGVQADIKAVAAAGGHACTVFTALTAQNTMGVQDVLPIPLDFVTRQFDSIYQDIGIEAIKTGMLHSRELVELVAGLIQRTNAPVVIDPVMVAKGGARLLQMDAVEAIRQKLIPLASLLTPNLDETETLLGYAVREPKSMEQAARDLVALGARAALVKGGHLPATTMDVLFDGKKIFTFTAPRIESTNTHGTGCTLASACACCLGQGMALPQAVAKAREIVRWGIKNALTLGAGHGPVHVLAGCQPPTARDRAE